MLPLLRSSIFWLSFCICAALLGIFFSWELGLIGDLLPRLPRPEPTQEEILFTTAIIVLLSFNTGLIFFRIKEGSCPIGARRASTIAGGLGVITLLCPVCLLIPVSLFGMSLSLLPLVPYLPLLRVIVLFLLIVSTLMLWPRNASSK